MIGLLAVFGLLSSGAVNGSDATQTNGYLLKTLWYQDGPFARFTPRQERLGCWSTAYAQILYYHRLQPTGVVRYECTSGEKIEADLGKQPFDWNLFRNSISAGTPNASAEEMARYSFATAVAVRKDFGTGGYKRLLNSVEDLEAHFNVDAEIYVCPGEKVPMPPDVLAAKLRSEKITNLIERAAIVELLTKEIAAKRPVYFHFGNIKDFGHSTVIDGIRKEGERHKVHINYGAVEPEMTKWYDLFAPITQADDEILRAFVTIKPRVAKDREQNE
jgi:hypothetical protein